MKFYLILLLAFASFNETKLKEAISYTDQKSAIIEIAKELDQIKENPEARIQIAKNIKLLTYAIEEEYLKAKPLVSAHYQYLKSNNYYGSANDKCLSAQKIISGTSAFESTIFESTENIKRNCDIIIENNKDNSWARNYFNIEYEQKELLKENNKVQELLQSTLEMQRIDATLTTEERKKIQEKKMIDQSQYYLDYELDDDY